MLAIFKKGTVQPPAELHSPAPLKGGVKPPKTPEEILKDFSSSNHENSVSIDFNGAVLSFAQPPKTISSRQSADDGVKLYWGVAADGSVVISDNKSVVKGGCAKSYAPFPAGCMFHSVGGLKSFEHPTRQMKAMPRVDSEGFICGASFKVDTLSKVNTTMPRVGSAASWEPWSS
uniref:DUF3700 domain-containing protein n=1 Tax=Kalanchoe fedtschenkoi TaxID=63787 RepID=A0A7N0TJJ0_KALFE